MNGGGFARAAGGVKCLFTSRGQPCFYWANGGSRALLEHTIEVVLKLTLTPYPLFLLFVEEPNVSTLTAVWTVLDLSGRSKRMYVVMKIERYAAYMVRQVQKWMRYCTTGFPLCYLKILMCSFMVFFERVFSPNTRRQAFHHAIILSKQMRPSIFQLFLFVYLDRTWCH